MDESGPTSLGESTSGGDGDGDGDPAGDETETGSDDWIHPETETEETDEPVPIMPTCTPVWTHVDSVSSHGHLGATPLGGREEGGGVTVNPVIGVGDDEVNVDSWFRSWSADGSIEWERNISWGDYRDDPLALIHDDLGDIFVAGRINANMHIEDAMVASLDGLGGDLRWSFLRGEGGGYTSLVHNGAAVIVAGEIGEFGARRLELVAFDPDTGEQLWSAAPELEMVNVATRGLVMRSGLIDVLVAGSGQVQVLRFEPPSDEVEVLANLESDSNGLVPSDLEYFGKNSLVALHESVLSVLALDDGEIGLELALDSLEIGSDVIATELVETPTGLAVAGTMLEDTNQRETFVLHLDQQFEVVCVGTLGKLDVPGVNYPPELRGLAVGPSGELITASYMTSPRLSVLARWE